MRALRCQQFGPLSELAVQEVDDPRPGAGEVLVRVRASAVNFPDVLLAQGLYQVRPDLPFTLGSELAGEVIELGYGVSSPQVGDRVFASMLHGAFAELAVVSAASATPVANTVDLQTAAAFGVTFTTAFHALHTVGEIEPGQWVVVLGAAGGVGMASIALARLAGARVIAAASSREKLAACADAGAEVLIDYSTEDLKLRIKAATGSGAHVVIDPVGGLLCEQALRALRPGGRLVVVGFASGEIPCLPMNLLLVKGISAHGLDLRSLHALHPEAMHAAGQTLSQQLASGLLSPMIGAIFSLDQAREAVQLVAERRAIGKVIVLP